MSITDFIYYTSRKAIFDADLWHYREIFRDQVYIWLYDRIRGNSLVLDIGANMGDTAIYFAMHPNTKRVWSYEPDIKEYRKLCYNTYKFQNKVITHNEALVHLPELPKKATPIAIKCDCEGAEYSIFSEQADLSGVYAILIEYHHGPKDIPKILESKGFKVSKSEKTTHNSKFSEIGYIYAERQ